MKLSFNENNIIRRNRFDSERELEIWMNGTIVLVWICGQRRVLDGAHSIMRNLTLVRPTIDLRTKANQTKSLCTPIRRDGAAAADAQSEILIQLKF